MASFSVKFQEHLCKGCELCKKACPQQIIIMKDSINAMGYHPAGLSHPSACKGCAICALVCPDIVISVSREG